MYAAQHSVTQRRRTGRHRRPSRVDVLTGGTGGMAPIAGAAAALKPGPKMASGVSAFTVGAVSLVGMAAPAHADGENLNMKEIAGVVQDVGLPCVSGTAIAQAESGGDTDINSKYPGEDSRGLFQINEAHGFDFDWNDAQANAEMAKQIYEDAGGWSPWGAYTNGSYEQYLDEARAACDDPAQASGGNSDDANVETASYTGKHRKSDGGGDSGSKSKATYTVQEGDTLGEIASERGTTWKHLAEMNPQIDDPNRIYPGDKLDVSGHPVK